MKSILITGISGFVGGYLAEYIARKYPRVSIHGISRTKPYWDFLPDIGNPINRISLHKGDMQDSAWVRSVFHDVQPDAVIHLAAQSSVAESWKSPGETIRGNLAYLVNMMEAAREHTPGSRILIVGSAEVYGQVTAVDLPLTENCPIQPLNPYAAARAAQEQIVAFYFRGFGLPVISTRSFNHIGPGQDTRFVVSSLARQVAEIAKGKMDPVLTMGDGSIIRDFLDVRDVVEAYLALLAKGQPGEVYNVCSGTGRSLGSIVNNLSEMLDISLKVQSSPDLIRPTDNAVIIGSREKIGKEIGWQPKIPFNETINGIYNYWYTKV